MARDWLSEKIAKHRPMSNPEKMHGGSRRGLTVHEEGKTRGPVNRRQDYTWLADYTNQRRTSYHLIYSPDTGQWIQMIPFDCAAFAMKGGDVDGRGNSANKAGTCNIQVCLAGYNVSHGGPKPDWGKAKNLWVLALLMERYEIPHRVRSRWGFGASRARGAWMQGGVQGHAHGPNDDHSDPGVINAVGMLRESRRQLKERRRKQRAERKSDTVRP